MRGRSRGLRCILGRQASVGRVSEETEVAANVRASDERAYERASVCVCERESERERETGGI